MTQSVAAEKRAQNFSRGKIQGSHYRKNEEGSQILQRKKGERRGGGRMHSFKCRIEGAVLSLHAEFPEGEKRRLKFRILGRGEKEGVSHK